MSDDLILTIVDRTWNDRLIESPNILTVEKDEELGSADNSATVTIPPTDPAAAYVPNPDDDAAEPTRFEVYSGSTRFFAGLIDKTTTRIDSDNNLTFGGIQRGGELAERNFGRRDLIAWPLPEVFRELLRDNIGRGPFATATATIEDIHHPAVSAITGEPQPEQYWSAPFEYAGVQYIGTESGFSTGGEVLVEYPAGIVAGDLLLLQAAGLFYDQNTPDGWVPYPGLGDLAEWDVPEEDQLRQVLYTKTADGTETGQVSFTYSTGGPIVSRRGAIHAFRNVIGVEALDTSSDVDSSSVLDVGVTTTGNKRLALNFWATSVAAESSAFTGESGGDWTSTYAYDTTDVPDTFVDLGFQSAEMPTAGTVNGGSFSLPAPMTWLNIGLALIGGTAIGPDNFPQILTIDLGSVQNVDAIRVIPEWATNKWYKWTLSTSEDGAGYTEQYDYDVAIPLGDRGYLVELGGVQMRYIQLQVNAASDGHLRIASVMALQNLAEPGDDTTYAVPWIENDDSGNMTLDGDTQRVVADGAFAGDGIFGHSFVTQLNTGGSITHTFRGISDAVYFTTVDSSSADFYVDTVLQASNVGIPANSYQYKGFEVTGLSVGQHTLEVVANYGTPRVDYFSGELQAAYRVVQENAPMIGYSGPWIKNYNDEFGSYGAKASRATGAIIRFPFYGDSIVVKFTKNFAMGKADWYIDDALQGEIDNYDPSPALFQVPMITWAGSYGPHVLRIVLNGTKNASASEYWIELDSIEGNFAHSIYLRSASDTNLSLIGRLSEMTNTFMRLNYDGTVDLLGAIGSDSGEIIREGENEGGTIEEGEVEGDWADAVSAILALGRGTDNGTLRVFVKDQPAVERLGIKVAKIENRDAVDAYLLVRQAWQTLQDSKYPKRSYRVTWSE